jgi:hypothetical protein
MAGASAVASVPGGVANHRALRFTVSTTPARRVNVMWDMYCGARHTGSSPDLNPVGSFSKTWAEAPGCSLSVTADLNEQRGTVRVAIYER